ncbi:MAG: ABC transporter permease subunit [Chloroflexota bacterium]
MSKSSTPIMAEKIPLRRVIIRWTLIAIILLWLILPMIPLLIWSFAFRWPFPNLWPESWSMQAWQHAFSDSSGVLDAIWDSVYIALIVTLLSVIISIPAGRGLGMYNFRGKRVVEFLLLAPTIVPPLAVILGVLVLFIRYGLADTYLGVILVQLSPIMPYVVLVMAGVFSNYNPEFEEQARSLGAGPIRTFWYVTLPAIFPGMMVAGLFAFLISWSQYITVLLIGGGFIKTLPLVLFTLAGTNDTPLTAAVSIIFVLPAVAILLLSSRYVTGEDAAIGGIGRV